MTYAEAAARLAGSAWGELSFVRSGGAGAVAAAVDEAVAAGEAVVPPPRAVFRALELTPPAAVKAVILGQDPYPRRADAMGLAFSVPRGRPVPASLRTVFEARQADLGLAAPGHGDLTAWARHGVMLLNVALTVPEGRPNGHARLGWEQLARDLLAAVDATTEGTVFMLWGGFAQRLGAGLDRRRHCVVETVHPSPLAHGPGPVHRFVAARPFGQAAAWRAGRGLAPLDWTLD